MLVFRGVDSYKRKNKKRSRFHDCTNTKYIQISRITATTAYIQIFVRFIVLKTGFRVFENVLLFRDKKRNECKNATIPQKYR